MELEHANQRSLKPGALIAGAILLTIGAGMLLDPTGTLSINPGRLIGPFILIGLGIANLFGSHNCGAGRARLSEQQWRTRRTAGSMGGLWLLGLGCWMLVSQTHLFGLTFATSWPLLLILVGLLIAMRGVR